MSATKAIHCSSYSANRLLKSWRNLRSLTASREELWQGAARQLLVSAAKLKPKMAINTSKDFFADEGRPSSRDYIAWFMLR
jgi:hypothetical protein